MLARWLQRQWFTQRRLTPALWFLLPLLLPINWLFVLGSTLKRRNTSTLQLPRPVIVVGNITVGGAGKTPLTIALAQALRERGWCPGIISRGYGGSNTSPRAVAPCDNPAEVGDEPLLMSRRTGLPVWIGRDRAAAGGALLAAHPEIDLLLCDDGLQHYRLERDVELAVFDRRGAGNGWRLPLGPLREPLSRLLDVDAVISNGPPAMGIASPTPLFEMYLQAGAFYAASNPAVHCTKEALFGKRLHAVAGIGDPQRFFTTLSGLGLDFEAHPFPDHHAYTRADLDFGPDAVLLMTEKDAVKCATLSAAEIWVLPIAAELPPALIDLIQEKLRGRPTA